jgi:hypothetical protein
VSGAQHPGGAPVGRLDALAPIEALCVRALRRWCDDGPEALARDLGLAMGEARGAAAAAAFDALCRRCLTGGRRPLMRHAAGCPCLGADEAAFALFVRTAAEGEREDAMLLACLMGRPAEVPALVHDAQRAGLELLRGLAAGGGRLH